jgi:alpha-galactosidase/6-phospho-beta-glucosidase family protein
MTGFKPKTNKKIRVFKNDQVTIDGKHMEFLQEFEKNENEVIPKLKSKILKLKKELDKKTSDEKMDIQDEIEKYIKKIKDLKKFKKNYFLDNSKYIYEYFENKQKISETTNTNSKNELLNNFFKLESSIPKNDKNIIIQKYISYSFNIICFYWCNRCINNNII